MAPDFSNERDQNWQALPLQLAGGLPYLTTQVGTNAEKSTRVKLLVDTGYRGPVSLTPDTHEGIDVPHEHFPSVGQGLSGDVPSKVGMAEFLSVGEFQFQNLPISYSISGGESDAGSNGLLGKEVLSRFNVVFDYPNTRMFVSPNTHFAVPLNAERSGLLIRPHRLGAVVKSIARETAMEAGALQVGDIITSIDDEPMTRSSIARHKRLLASERDRVSVCWLSQDLPRCGHLELDSRFDSHDSLIFTDPLAFDVAQVSGGTHCDLPLLH